MDTILHVEVGGTYGGSLRALELYLRHTARTDLRHELLLYYPTPGLARISALVSKVHVLSDAVPGWLQPAPAQQNNRKTRGTVVRALAPWLRLLSDAGVIRKLSRLYAAGDYALIHVNNTFPYAAAAITAARIRGIPAVGHVRNPVAHSTFSRTIGAMLDTIVTVSNSYARDLHSWAPGWNAVASYDSVEPPAPSSAAAQQLRTTLLGDGRILVGAAGRLDPQKGFADWIEAAATVSRELPHVRFAIAGEGPLRGALEAAIQRHGLEDRVQLCGFLDDVASFLMALDLYVSSSLWEGLPISIVEAMLLGKPVVATDVGGVSEVVIPECGRLVRAGSSEALAASVIAAIGDLPPSPQQVELTRSTAAELSDPDRNASELDEIFAGLLRRRPTSVKERNYARTVGRA